MARRARQLTDKGSESGNLRITVSVSKGARGTSGFPSRISEQTDPFGTGTAGDATQTVNGTFGMRLTDVIYVGSECLRVQNGGDHLMRQG